MPALRGDQSGLLRQNEALAAEIRAVHAESRGTYGSPRIHRALRKRGHRVGKNRVARLMHAHGIKARVATIRYTSPGMQRYFGAVLNEQLDLELKRPDQVWVGDITYLKVGAIYRYLAVVMDKYSRCVVGWSYGRRKDVALTLRALSAVRRRRPRSGLVFHTDRGTEYAGAAFKERLAELGFIQSMNRPGVELRAALKSYVPFYNQDRLHSSLQYVPPATFEQQARRTGCQ